MAWMAIEGAIGYQVYVEVEVSVGMTDEGLVDLEEPTTVFVPWGFVEQGEGEIIQAGVALFSYGRIAVSAVYLIDGEPVPSEKTYLWIPASADFNDNGRIDLEDFFLFADAFGSTEQQFDLDGSGTVGFGDLYIFVDAFNAHRI